MGFRECPPLELLEAADPAPAPCGPCAAPLAAPNETLTVATTATTRNNFFIYPSNRSLRPTSETRTGPLASVGHGVLRGARPWRAGTPPIGHVVLSDRNIERRAR